MRKSTGLVDTQRNRKRVEKEVLPFLDEEMPQKKVKHYYQVVKQLKECKQSTHEADECLWRCHVSFFSDRYIDEIKRSEVKQWLNGLNLSPKTKRHVLSLLSQIFDEAIDDEAVEKNICKGIKLPKLIKYEPEPFTQEEMALLIRYSEGWFRNLLAVLFLTGVRIGEALALEWDDIKENKIIISKSIRRNIVSTTKTGNVREIPLFEDLKPFLKEQSYLSGLNKRVFYYVSDSAKLSKRWRELQQKCGMKDRILYQTRHTFAINALDSGRFKVSQIAKILGHTSTQMIFQKYAKFIKSEADDLDNTFSTFRHNLGTLTA